jgi:hypothetical protein
MNFLPISSGHENNPNVEKLVRIQGEKLTRTLSEPTEVRRKMGEFDPIKMIVSQR